MSRRTPEAERAYVNRRNRLIAYGRWQPQTFVDAARARAHIRMLNQAEIGIQRVADLAGVSKTTVCRIVYDPKHTIRPDVEQRILAIRPTADNRNPNLPIDATGTRRRLQALVAVGWSLRILASRVSMRHASLALIANGGRLEVLPATTRAIEELYDHLWDCRPPQATRAERISVAKSRSLAARRKWVVPAAWDDDTINDPAAKPDLGARARRGDAMVENSDWLIAQGSTLEQAAERLGVKPGSLRRARERAAARERVSA
jgi:transcriptional regulator with XRE-family HTH domain